ncbi:MAG: MFS transporter [Elusimicrobia bacterium]|nr:MFS transporter [Elusimicrobiota bacterium]
MAPRYSPLLACLLLIFGECSPAWSRALQQTVAAQPTAPAGAIGRPIRLDLTPGIVPLPSAGLILSNPALPSLTLPAAKTKPAGAALSARAAVETPAVVAPAPSAQVKADVLGFKALPTARQEAAPAKEKPLPEKLSDLQKGISDDRESLAKAGEETAGAIASKSFDRLIGARSAPSAGQTEEPVPGAETQSKNLLSPSSSRDQIPESPQKLDPAKARAARLALTGTGIFKFGMEALNIAIPLIALTYFGSAVWMATMAVTWGVSMTVASLFAGGMIDRKPANKVISGAMGVQFLSVTAMILLLLSGAVSPLLILPLHALSGAAMGVITTARDCIPARILGRDHAVLGKFNSKTHLIYEIAGTIAPILIGLLIRRFGLVSALFIHPPAYLLAAIFFYRLNLGEPVRSEAAGAPAAGILDKVKRVASDIRAGARIMFSTREFRWLGFMILGPMVVHRVVEQILVPVFVKTVLNSVQQSAWIVSASNFGELVGAALLLKALSSAQDRKLKPSRYRWIPLMALGTLAVWSLSMPGGLLFVLPLIFFMSVTWAANDISMTSYFQSRLPNESAGKAVGFLMAAELGLIMVFSYLLGFLFDFLPAPLVFLAVNIGLTALAWAFWKSQKKLRRAGASPSLRARKGII